MNTLPGLRSDSAVAVFFSGGKDSFYALSRVREWTKLLISFQSRKGMQYHACPEASSALHDAQVRLTMLPHRALMLPNDHKGRFEAQVSQLLPIIEEFNITHVATGDLWHETSIAYGNALAKRLGVGILRPGNHVCPSPSCNESYMRTVIDSGIEAVIISVRVDLPRSWIGRTITHSLLDEMLCLGVDATAENAEYQSTVVASPIMQGRINLSPFNKVARIQGQREYRRGAFVCMATDHFEVHLLPGSRLTHLRQCLGVDNVP